MPEGEYLVPLGVADVKRVGAKNGIAPQSHILEAAFLPNVNDILAAANSIL